MDITILSENMAGSGFLAEHGLSYLIDDGAQRFLFDTGSSDVFLHNAQLLGIAIDECVDTVILSHGHWDHGNGLKHLQNKKLVTHPSAFIKRFRKADHSPIGLSLSRDELAQQFQLQISSEPLKLTGHIWYLGEIPRLNDFESKTTSFIDENGQPDFVPDDSALALIVQNQLLIVTACSHAGVCNIVDYAIKVTGVDSILGIMGGFHLKGVNDVTQHTREYLRNRKVKAIYPSHCTDIEAQCLLFKDYPAVSVKTGQVFSFGNKYSYPS